jgi:CHAT domain-containing protein
MKDVNELTKMSSDERQSYLEAHQDEITYQWLRLAKEENDRRGWKDPAQARESARILVEAAEVEGESSILALAHWALGNAHMFCDRPREAIESFERSVDLYREAGRLLDVARVQVSRVAVETDRGYPEEALEIAERIRPVIESSPEEQDRRRVATLALNMGIAMELRGDYEAALATYRRAQEVMREIAPDDETEVARIEQNRALILTKLNRFDEAKAAYLEALDTLENHEVTSDVVRVYTALGWLYDRAGRDADAEEVFSEAHSWLDRLSDKESLQAADLALHRFKWCLKRDPHAVVNEIARLRKAYAGRTFLYEQEAALLEARARLQSGDAEGSRRVCAEVEEVLSGRSLAGLLWRLHHLVGRAWEEEGDLSKARACYEEALEIIERDQRRISDVELRASALEDKLDVYRDLVSLLVKERDYKAAMEVVERSKARALVDALTARLGDIPPREETPAVQRLRRELDELRAELDRRYRQQRTEMEEASGVREASSTTNNEIARMEQAYIEKARELSRLDPAYGSVLGTYIASPDEVQQSLPPDTLLAEYYTVQAKLFVLLLSSDGSLAHFELGEMSEIEPLVEQLPHRSLKSPSEDVWSDLYDQLVAPWADSLEGVQRIVVVPDGPLHYVPFQALCDTDGYLIERHEVSYAPSATMLALTAQVEPVWRDAMLALGYDGGQLSHVPAEMGAIAGSFPELTMFTGEQAGRGRLEAFAAQANVIHVAAHGDFRPDAPLFSFVALADGRWQAADVYLQCMNASLVTLGACQTGRGRLTGSDLIGFAHALFYAGAQAAMVSLWSVQDASTAALMATFYRGIREGMHKSAALRRAQLALLQSDGENRRWRDPLYWAPFCLIGSDGIVSVTGLVRTVRRIVESGSLSLEASQILLERLDRIIKTYQETNDQYQATGQVAGLVDAFPELEPLIKRVWEKNLHLDQMAVKMGRAAEEVIRLSSAEEIAERETGKSKLPPATSDDSPDPNWPTSVQSLWKLRESVREFGRKARRTPGGRDDTGR